MSADKAYEWLKKHSIETAYLISSAEVLAWDQRTNMPRNGGAHRAEQMAAIAKLLHERTTDERIGEHLSQLEESDFVSDPLSPMSVNVREWRRDFDRSTKIPAKLAVELARATTVGEDLWERSRPTSDWTTFAPALDSVLRLTREKAEALGYDQEAYDVLLDEYEPGLTTATLEKLLNELGDQLRPLLDRISDSSVSPSVEVLQRGFSPDAQERFCRKIASDIGYDFGSGRLDVAAHPFTIGIGPGDVRITTRYQMGFLGTAVFGTLHEAGHGIYEQGLPREHWGTPRGQVTSLGMHESQSRMWENMVGRSRGFWRFQLEHAARELPGLDGVDLDTFLGAVNTVRPGLIRVEADEVTYNLHIILRFELELALMRGRISVGDLPELWDSKMKEYLGVEVSNAAVGVMQDVHWSGGLFGYFPTYTLGNLYAAQLFDRAEEDIGSLEERFAKGDFASLLEWLREKVHELGGTYKAKDLVCRATGSSLSSAYFMKYLTDKYSALYNL